MRTFNMLWRSDCRSVLYSASMRVEELVVQRHLRLSRTELRNLRLWNVDRCEDTAELWRAAAAGAPTGSGEDELLPTITVELVSAIEAALPAMRDEMKAIKSDKDVKAGLGMWAAGEDVPADSEPAYDKETVANLDAMVAAVCPTADDARVTHAMLRQYLSLYSLVTTDGADPKSVPPRAAVAADAVVGH